MVASWELNRNENHTNSEETLHNLKFKYPSSWCSTPWLLSFALPSVHHWHLQNCRHKNANTSVNFENTTPKVESWISSKVHSLQKLLHKPNFPKQMLPNSVDMFGIWDQHWQMEACPRKSTHDRWFMTCPPKQRGGYHTMNEKNR